MKTIIVLLGIISCSYSSDWNFGSHDDGGGLTLGEISLDHYGLGGTESHSLDLLGGHLPIKISDWHSATSGLHGVNVIPTVKHIDMISWQISSITTKTKEHLIGIPTVQKIPINIPHPVVETVPQPYPVPVVVSKPVPFEVEKQIIKTVEKKIPTPVEKIIPVKIEKPVPFHVVKHVPVQVEKPIPIKIPIYKTIVHKVKH